MKEDIKYLSISELNRIIKMKFDSSAFFNRVFIKGEISNFKVQMPSGHCYFTIKDEMSRISAVMFKGTANKVGTNFKDGDMVNVVGKISVYEASGNYQIYIESMELNGSGDLYKKFLLLKEKLYKEGLFDESHKKQIPKYPKKIGVVTASTGAAIRDIITTIKRRYPLCEVILFPSLVQGVSAKEDIVKKIELANTFDIDTLIVGRGGGSIEDLWAYNEEIVARAIYDSELPIISAVGHETDFTIADFVADLRAPTPSAAAELAVPDVYELKQKINNYQNRYRLALKKKNELMRLRYEKCMKSRVFTDPLRKIRDMDVTVDSYIQRLENKMKIIHKDSQSSYIKLVSKLDTLSPLKTLTRGYSLTEKDSKIVKSAKELEKDDKVKLKFSDGEKDAIIC